MKKLSFFLMAMLFSVMSFAATETISCPAGTVVSSKITMDFKSLTFLQEQGSSTSAVKAYSPWRIYKNHKVTFTPQTDVTIENLVITCTGSDYAKNGTLTNATATLSGTTLTITPTDGTQAFTFAATVAQVRWQKIVVTYKVAGEVVAVEAPKFDVTTSNFTEAFSLNITSAEGTTLKYTTDTTDPATSATAVVINTNTATVAIPAKSTMVRAIAIKGEDVSEEKETTYCYVNSPATAYTVAEAMEVIDAGLGLTNELYVKGEISTIEKYDANYGSITYWIKDEEGNKFECYSGLGLNKAKFTKKEDLVVGSKVVVCGTMKKFNTTYEFNYNNYIVSLELPVVKFNVTVTAENGTVAGAGEYEENAEVTLTATPAEGYEFTCWTSGEDTVSTANPYTFAVTANLALVANFKEVVVEEPVEAKLYLTPNANWKQSNARFAAYFFDNGETWVGMTKVAGETDLYEVTIPTDKKYPKVIFCRMNPSAAANNWNNKWNQTADLVIPTDGKNHYTVKEGTWDNGGGTWSIWPIPTVKTYVDITITVTANAPASIKWANAGDKLADATEYVAMTAGENNTYTYTLAQVDELKGVDYTVKVGEAVSATQNTSKNVTVDFKALLPQVAVQGVNNWDGTDKMTIADDYLTASITLPLVAKKYDLKLTLDATWKGTTSNNITRENNSSAFTGDSGNGSITADIAGDYVFTYTYATQTLTVTYPALLVKYNVTVTAENGTVEGAGEYEENAEATLTATAAEGYEFVNWTVGDSIVSTENPYKFTVTADLALVANFKEAVTTITETFDLTTEDTRNLMGTYNVDAGDYLLRIYGYEGAGTYQDDPATEEVVEVQLFTPDYEDPLNAVVVVTIDEENNKEVMQVTAASADGTKIYNLTFNIVAPEIQEHVLYITYPTITVEESPMGGVMYIIEEAEAMMDTEDNIVTVGMTILPSMNYAEMSIGDDIYATGEALVSPPFMGEFTIEAILTDEAGNTYNVTVLAQEIKQDIEIVVADTVELNGYNMTFEMQGNMAIVTANVQGIELFFWMTMYSDDNGYGTYFNDAITNVWYGENSLTPYGDEHVYSAENLKVSFINDPDAEGNVTLYNFTLYAGDQPTGVDNINTTVAPVKVIENGQIFIIRNGVKYNAQGAKL